jgi:hypothetical protein
MSLSVETDTRTDLIATHGSVVFRQGACVAEDEQTTEIKKPRRHTARIHLHAC